MKHKGLIFFLIIVTVLSGGYILVMKLAGEYGAYLAQGYMLMPAIAALITRAFFDPMKFSDVNFRFGRWADYLKFWLFGLGITALSYAAYTLMSAGSWDFSGQVFINRISAQFAAQGQDLAAMTPEGMSARGMVWLYFAAGLTVLNILPGLVTGLGEELGWRGLLFPRLYVIRPWMGFILGGLIWFGWHVPLSLVIPQQAGQGSQAANIAILAAGSLCTFIYLAYVYASSRSVLVTALAHAVMNNAAQSFSYFFILENQFMANLGLTAAMALVVLYLYLSGRFAQFADYFQNLAHEKNHAPGPV